MKDGDIYIWRFKLEAFSKRDKFGSPYHCMSLIAVAKDGRLYDTFWTTTHDAYCLDMDDCEITFQGNPAAMKQIASYDAIFYRPEDLVDMRHSNSSRELVYAKPGTSRNQTIMREYYESRIDDSQREIRWAASRIDECNAILAKIASGETDGYFPVWSKT